MEEKTLEEKIDDDSLEWNKAFQEDIIKYSIIISDEEKEINNAYVRVRRLKCNDKRYIHVMVNGECVCCERILK